MRKIYLFIAFAAFSIQGVRAQTCTNSPSGVAACTGTVTQNFNSNDGGFTSSTFSWNATNGNFSGSVLRNNTYTISSGTYVMSQTGGVVGFNFGGTANIQSITIRIIRVSDNVQVFSCTQTACCQVIAPGQVCVTFGGLTVGQGYRFVFDFDMANGASGDGTVTFDNFSNGGSGAALPVKLDNFDAASQGSAVKLTWVASVEDGVARYEIQRSADGKNFQTIASVNAANLGTYTYVDALPASSNNFYRLRIVDLDNVSRISQIVSIRSKVSMGIEAYPNPVRDRMVVQHPKAISGARMQVVSLGGQILRDMPVPANAVITPVDLTGFSSGTYYIVYRSGAENLSQRITKQ